MTDTDDVSIPDDNIKKLPIMTIESYTTQQCGFTGPVGFTPAAWTELIMRFGTASDSALFDTLHAARSAMSRAVREGKLDVSLEFQVSVKIDGTRQLVDCVMAPTLTGRHLLPLVSLKTE